MKHAIASVVQMGSRPINWRDTPVVTPIVQDAPTRRFALPEPRLQQFPVSVGPNEPIHQYRHTCQRAMRVWVALMLKGKFPATEHDAWKAVTDLAVAQIGRSLHGVEGELVTSAVRDVWNALEAERMHTPGRIFG